VSARKRRSDIDRSAVFEAILGDLGSEEAEASLGTVPLAEIRYNDRQPRHHMDPASLGQLTASIRDRGVLEPVLLRRVDDGYELVAGERRTRAAIDAGLTHVPAIVLDLNDRDALEISIIENLQREDLNAVEETEAVLSLLELTLETDRAGAVALLHEVYQEHRGRTSEGRFTQAQKRAAEALFTRVGRFTPVSFLVNRVPILSFPEEVLSAVRTGRLAFTKAQAIVRVEDEAARGELLAQAIEQDLSLSQIRRRITEIRADDSTDRPAGERVVLAINATRRLLTRKRVSSLPIETRERITDLLEELQGLLGE
jgi:ParB family transcriptional regulator, chromosome partitioning protein